MKKAVLFLAQLCLIWAVYQCSIFIVRYFHLPIPTSVLGMILLYLLLSSKIIQLRYIDKGAAFLNKHLGFFFIPIAVGLMNYGSLINSVGLQLLIMIAGSTIIGLMVAAKLTEYLSRREPGKDKHSHSS
ncbi:murein hydrolase regulator LrgA [Bacillus sp. FJAT-27225]|uniref:CidA/LrgA family protein n=1 Tax=Bacillus sp. FJAT-27225 TaxID=1743144 RepID=UPI00080C22D5|nr:CidA/LrgA family protein [Bacillus sp. FJAT-27225]OCA84077.1 murein hydrolase regulator LrgA [Bacillus sp. FJAT-27225]